MNASTQLPVARPAGTPPASDWLGDARRARLLSWLSLGWMTVEGAVGVIAGLVASSVALTGFGLSSAVEGLASVIVIWRFTGSRTHSETSERRAQRAVAVSFWLLAPYVAIESAHKLLTSEQPQTSSAGIALTATSLVLMVERDEPVSVSSTRPPGTHRLRAAGAGWETKKTTTVRRTAEMVAAT